MPTHQADTQTLLSLDAVNKEYHSKKSRPVSALQDVTLHVREGEVMTFVGPSGCGKSTLLKTMAGLLPPSSGSVFLSGEQHNEPSESIGIVYQQPLLLPWKNVLENVLVPIRVRKMDLRIYKNHAQDLLKKIGLAGFEDSYPHQLSGGMQQRVGIARAMVQNPDVLLMDEPFGALDAMTREQLTDELIRIQEEFGKTVAFVTHSIVESVLLADRVVVMTPRPGRIAKIIGIELPRPREMGVVNTPQFGRYADEIRGLLKGA